MLTKTAYLAYSQCPKQLWLDAYQPELAAPPDPTAQRRLRAGQCQKALAELQFLLYFFDFETIDHAIPAFDGCKPFQQVPFQYSCHIVAEDGTVTHCDYCHLDTLAMVEIHNRLACL